jgi:methylglutaconyl-CoA hydratase
MTEAARTLSTPSREAIRVEDDGSVLHVFLNPWQRDDTLDVAVLDDLLRLLNDLRARPDTAS